MSASKIFIHWLSSYLGECTVKYVTISPIKQVIKIANIFISPKLLTTEIDSDAGHWNIKRKCNPHKNLAVVVVVIVSIFSFSSQSINFQIFRLISVISNEQKLHLESINLRWKLAPEFLKIRRFLYILFIAMNGIG